MFENMDMSNMSKMLEGIQQNAKKMDEELASKSYTAKSGAGMVSVSISGKGEVIDIDIDDSLLEDKDSLQLLLMASFNDALKMVEDAKKASAMGMLGGMSPFK
ncbi:MAG: YbaB/EbfC family nucleoid-associated protein [Campylobacterota bacterium]|nr:YbaB/EbfC family nucleoid-associated protein [Campylobacterota bacterium]